VDSYLSGICNQLETLFPEVRTVRNSTLVCRTLKGAKWRHRKSTSRKAPLSWSHLSSIFEAYESSRAHDDLLFQAQLITGFCGLMRLGDLTDPDRNDTCDPAKRCLHSSLQWNAQSYSFLLPRHKSDVFFEGDHILVQKRTSHPDPHRMMVLYVTSRDKLWPLMPELWVKLDGTIPKRSWFLNRLRTFLPPQLAGHSLRAGGATALAIAGTRHELIKAAGRWSSDAFERYIRKNPFLLQAMLVGTSSAFDATSSAKV
jgi:hypothetical protein